jgi:hypothetical protein
MKNKEMVNFLKIKYIFNVLFGFCKNHEYACNSGNNFQYIDISSFFMSQRAVKSWIIANIKEIIVSKEFVLHFERKTFKIKPQKGHFGSKWQINKLSSDHCCQHRHYLGDNMVAISQVNSTLILFVCNSKIIVHTFLLLFKLMRI